MNWYLVLYKEYLRISWLESPWYKPNFRNRAFPCSQKKNDIRDRLHRWLCWSWSSWSWSWSCSSWSSWSSWSSCQTHPENLKIECVIKNSSHTEKILHLTEIVSPFTKIRLAQSKIKPLVQTISSLLLTKGILILDNDIVRNSLNGSIQKGYNFNLST